MSLAGVGSIERHELSFFGTRAELARLLSEIRTLTSRAEVALEKPQPQLLKWELPLRRLSLRRTDSNIVVSLDGVDAEISGSETALDLFVIKIERDLANEALEFTEVIYWPDHPFLSAPSMSMTFYFEKVPAGGDDIGMLH